MTRHLRAQLLASIQAYEAAKKRFATVTAAYTDRPGVDPADAETKAAADPRRKKAGEDCGWHGAEMQRYAAALTALALTEHTTWDQHCAEAQRLTVGSTR